MSAQSKEDELENLRLDVLDAIDNAMLRFVSRADISAMLFSIATQLKNEK